MSITVKAVARSFGDHRVFSDVSFQLSKGEHAALIGRNGSGKSTLLRILAGVDTPDDGSVTTSGNVTMLSQQTPTTRGTVLDSVTPTKLTEARERLELASKALHDPTGTALAEYGAAEEEFRLLGGYDFEARANAVLSGLGLDPTGKLDRLSGGQQRRAMLAALLLSPAEALLLDEPTNHLDTASREWLEGWIRDSPSTILLVSHDRWFLDRTVSRVLELERGSLREWPGNYSEAMQVKRQQLEAQQRDWEAQERRKARLKAEAGRLASIARSADRFSHRRAGNVPLITAKGKAEDTSRTMARRARSLEARIERMDEAERPWQDRLRVTVPLPDAPPGPHEVLTVRSLTVERAGRQLVSGVDLDIRRGEKVALIGPNGSGKTSLLLAVVGQLEYEGRVTTGHGLTVFAAWQQSEELDAYETVGEALLGAQAELRRQDQHQLLGQLQLPGPEHRVEDLSGGQRTRLALARLSVTRASLLVLDEPTNNLDLEALEALEQLLLDFPGTLLFTSHDRQLVSSIASRVIDLASLGS